MYVIRHAMLSSLWVVSVAACQPMERVEQEVTLAAHAEASPTLAAASSESNGGGSASTDAGISREAARAVLESPYPRGPWRNAARTELKDVVLWVSHVLIRHRDVRGRAVSFCTAGWHSTPPLPERSRVDALELARRLAQQARQNPKAFAQLAAQHSEDITTRERGGSLGGVTAIHLIQWPQVLDALAVVRPGEASQVIETEYGFHVLYRSPPPRKQLVSGSRIVIGHDQAEFLPQLRGEALTARSREAGLALAQEARAKILAHPERLVQWVTEYSEHPDAIVGGDMGEWSTWEPTDYPRQVQLLSSLAVGEVATPLETLFGWEILVRTKNRARPQYAMTPVEVPFEIETSPSSTDTSARATALARADELAQLLRTEPQKFTELQQQGCCQYVVQWPEGKGWPPLMAALKPLQPGEIAASPIAFGLSYVIPKRVEAMPLEPVVARFDLPASGPAL